MLLRNKSKKVIDPLLHVEQNNFIKSQQAKKLSLTEPQSPHLMTAQRSKIRIKRDRNSYQKEHDVQVDEPETAVSSFSAFDRLANEPAKKVRRTSLTEPKPFHFCTEARALVRSTSTGYLSDSDVVIDKEKKTIPNWEPKLTEPHPFNFETDRRANIRKLSKPQDVTSDQEDQPVHNRSSVDSHEAQQTKQAIYPKPLTQPQPFNFQTDQRSAIKQLAKGTDTKTKPLVRVPLAKISNSVLNKRESKSVAARKPVLQNRTLRRPTSIDIGND